MAKGTTRTIRAQADFWAAIDAHAQEQDISANAAVVGLAWIGLGNTTQPAPVAVPPAPKAVPAVAEAKAAHLARPKLTPAQRAFRAVTKRLPDGPPPSPPGSRLKTSVKPKRN